MNERINPESEAHALALGRYWIEHAPGRRRRARQIRLSLPVLP